MTNVNVNDFKEEKTCVYKNETYSVRDNGAVLRHPKEGGIKRKNDNIWTFGKANNRTGYMEISSKRIHRIVAVAFHGDPPTPQQNIVDHIDTNRQNNRPDNLRWVTKLDNIVLNPISCRKMEILCGCSIEEILKDPSILHKHSLPPEFSWMGQVTQKEAKESLERLSRWAKRTGIIETKRRKINIKGNWCVLSDTRGAVQALNTKPVAFPCCPHTETDNPLENYKKNINKGDVFVKAEKYIQRVVDDATLSDDHDKLIVPCEYDEVTIDIAQLDYRTAWQVIYRDGVYVHEFYNPFPL